jgi:magnesium-transporting ATPase (P-type)
MCPPLHWYERQRLFRAYRFFVPRMFQMTAVWLIVYTATAVGWIIYLRDVDNNATELDHQITLATAFYTLMLGVISFILVIDWSAGTVRYQTCATNFLAIVDLTSAFANTLVHNVNAEKNAPAVVSAVTHIQHVVRAIPYTLIVFYRDINLSAGTRRATLSTRGSSTAPATVTGRWCRSKHSKKASKRIRRSKQRTLRSTTRLRRTCRSSRNSAQSTRKRARR